MGGRGPDCSVLLLLLGLGCSAGHHEAQGRAALEAHDLATAEQAFRRALDRDPRHVDSLAGLGWTYHLAGQRGAARSAFARCVDLAAENAECLRGLGSLALAEGQPGIARDLLGRALAAAPDDPKVLSSVALMNLGLGEVEKAQERYNELVRRFPDNAAYRMGLAESLLRLEQPLRTIEEVEAGLAIGETPVRYQAMLWQLKARALVAASGGRENPEDCANTAEPVRAWLDAAQMAVDRALQLDVGLPDLPAVRRQVLRRRAVLDGNCPLGTPAASEILAPTSEP